jgi:hypothetical protein
MAPGPRRSSVASHSTLPMLDRSTPNLFQADRPPDGLQETPAAPLEDAGIPARPTVAHARTERGHSFTLPRPWRGAGSLAWGARAAWRSARHLLTPLLIVLAVSRLAAGGCSSLSASDATRPNPVAPTLSAAHVRRPAARTVPARRVACRRPIRHAHRRRPPAPPVTTPRWAPRTPPISPAAALATIAPSPSGTPVPDPKVGTDGEGQEFGFEH